MRTLLSQKLGAPLGLARRGSTRARTLALCVTVFGAISTALGIAYSLTLVIIGGPCFAFGAGALGALSQRIVRR
jgi:hypothetical protein